jgi:hypothetical protein
MEIPDGWGSQASLAGGIIQVAGAFRDSDRMQELYHELSHLWNAVDLDAPSPRWNEGLAMFLQGRLAREIDGWDGESAALDRTAARLLERCGSGEPCGSVPLRHYGDEELTDYSYFCRPPDVRRPVRGARGGGVRSRAAQALPDVPGVWRVYR